MRGNKINCEYIVEAPISAISEELLRILEIAGKTEINRDTCNNVILLLPIMHIFEEKDRDTALAFQGMLKLAGTGKVQLKELLK